MNLRPLWASAVFNVENVIYDDANGMKPLVTENVKNFRNENIKICNYWYLR
jgi:hypothetical protein